MDTPIPTVSDDPADSSLQGDDAGQVQQVRTTALALLNKAEGTASTADMAVTLEKAAVALKLTAEMEKVRADLVKTNEEIAKLKRENQSASRRDRSERLRDYVALLTPLVTIVTLAATLITQNWQFLRSERNKQDDALDAKWQDAVKTISATGALSPGVIALQPFLNSPKYKEQAREVAVNLLSNSSDPIFFTSLFGAALTPTNSSNVQAVLRLDRALAVRYAPLATKTWDPRKQTNDTKQLTNGELAAYQYIQGAVETITAQIGGVLRTSRPIGTHFDLSATFFRNGDWQIINFDGTNWEGMRLTWSSLKDADLSKVTQFSGVYLYRTAWWEAKSINKPLLEHLMTDSPFVENATYGPQEEKFTRATYDAAVRRLTAQLK